jgi:hypothetical protein
MSMEHASLPDSCVDLVHCTNSKTHSSLGKGGICDRRSAVITCSVRYHEERFIAKDALSSLKTNRRDLAGLGDWGWNMRCRPGRVYKGGHMGPSSSGSSLQIRRRATSTPYSHRSNKRRSASVPCAAGQHGLRRRPTTRRRSLKILNTRPRGIGSRERCTGVHLSKPRPRPEAFLRPRASRGLTWKETIV